MDVVTAFLHPHLAEEVYMCQPEGYDDGSSQVCQLNKALYGLKQAPRAWFNSISTYFQTIGLHQSISDTNLYIGRTVRVLLWVDDILFSVIHQRTPTE